VAGSGFSYFEHRSVPRSHRPEEAARPRHVTGTRHAPPDYSAIERDARTVITVLPGLAASLAEARRAGEGPRLTGRLLEALETARTVVGEVVGLVDRLDTGRGRPRIDDEALRTARAVPWRMLLRRDDAEPDAEQLEVAAALTTALGRTDPDTDRGYADLRLDLQLLQRALRDAAHRADRPWSQERLILLLGETGRIVTTVAVGVLAAAAAALQSRSPGAAAVLVAVTGSVVGPACQGVLDLVRHWVGPASVNQRLVRVHDELRYVVEDLAGYLGRVLRGEAEGAADEGGRETIEETYSVGLLLAGHAARLARSLDWESADVYVRTANQVAAVLGAAMQALRSEQPDGRRERLEQAVLSVRDTADGLRQHRIPGDLTVHSLAGRRGPE
jgi:hypothetical protein